MPRAISLTAKKRFANETQIPRKTRAKPASSNFRQLYLEKFTVSPFELTATFTAQVFNSVEPERGHSCPQQCKQSGRDFLFLYRSSTKNKTAPPKRAKRSRF